MHRTFETPDINFYGKFSRVSLREGSRRARISSLIPEARTVAQSAIFISCRHISAHRQFPRLLPRRTAHTHTHMCNGVLSDSTLGPTCRITFDWRALLLLFRRCLRQVSFGIHLRIHLTRKGRKNS